MDKELYDKILLLMSVDTAHEVDFGYRYVEQGIFDELLEKSNVSSPDMKYVKNRIQTIMDSMIEELIK